MLFQAAEKVPSETDQVTVSAPAERSLASKRVEALTRFLVGKYRDSPDATRDLVDTAYLQGSRIGIDPLLILAVIAIESRFNPSAVSSTGAKGLIQVIPRYHADKLDVSNNRDSILDPETNIQLGARILQEYIRRGGSVVVGLQMYNGMLSDGRKVYANKVLGEHQRLKQVVHRFQTTA